MTTKAESHEDIMARLALMQRADQDDTWDLSPNDRAAIRSALIDMRRYAVLKSRFIGADFAWGADKDSVLVFQMKQGEQIGIDLDQFIDAAMDAAEGSA